MSTEDLYCTRKEMMCVVCVDCGMCFGYSAKSEAGKIDVQSCYGQGVVFCMRCATRMEN